MSTNQNSKSEGNGLKGIDSAVALNNGVAMPWLGLGVWQIHDDAETERTVCTAIEQGYRSVDTARIYGNERGVGQAIRSCGVPREQLFVTTKVWTDDIRSDRIAEAFDESMTRLGLDYVDLYLVHWPVSGRIARAWAAMEAIAQSGRVKSIGVSNHMPTHLEELLARATIVPAVNQVEFHPYLQCRDLLEFCRQAKIQVEAWSPLMQAGRMLRDSVLAEIARRHGRSVAQVVLRWDLQMGVVTIPKSANAERIAENAAIFDFALSDADMKAIAALDRNERSGANPYSFPF